MTFTVVIALNGVWYCYIDAEGKPHATFAHTSNPAQASKGVQGADWKEVI